jgi:hypothetical protein
MESEREEGSLALHARKTGLEFDFGKRERVTGVKGSVHVGECHAAEELGVVLADNIDIVGGVLLDRGGIGFKDVVLGPLRLVLLLDRDEGITFIRLSKR